MIRLARQPLLLSTLLLGMLWAQFASESVDHNHDRALEHCVVCLQASDLGSAAEPTTVITPLWFATNKPQLTIPAPLQAADHQQPIRGPPATSPA